MNMIVAVNPHGIIGRNNKMLWHIPEDMQHFRRETMNTIVVMGRKTFESLPCGPLESRMNVVITSRPEKYITIEHPFTIFCNLDDCENILYKLQTTTGKPVFIIGGSQIYYHFFKKCKTIYITKVESYEREGVSIYPMLDEIQSTYTLISITPQKENANTVIKYEFIIYDSPLPDEYICSKLQNLKYTYNIT